MGKSIKIQVGERYNAWKVIEANIINPITKNKNYINKPLFSLCLCTNCNKNTRYFLNSELKNASNECNSCAVIRRNISNRTVKIGDIYGYLQVTGDGGYITRNDNKRRHCSKCKCLLCGNENVLKLDNQLQTGNTVSCGCLCSKGEQKIIEILTKANIDFDRDVPFYDLTIKTGRRLRFDFIIYNKDNSINRFVEFDGNQHKDKWVGGSWSHIENLEDIKERDNIKNKYCIENNYKLVRIPYNQLNKLTLEDIMTDKFVIKEGSDEL